MNSISEQKRISFGYNRGIANQIELHQGQAAAVRLIYQLYENGQSLASIAERLENINAPSPYNKPKWGRQTLSNILSNPHYLGDEVYPKLIEHEQFEIVQQRKKDSAPISVVK